MAQECVAAGCGVELFLFNSSYIDAATLGQLPRLTGGSLYKYTYFQVNNTSIVEERYRNGPKLVPWGTPDFDYFWSSSCLTAPT